MVAIAGLLFELTHGVAAVKAGQLHDLGVSPAVGVTVNLVHSTAAFLLFLVVTDRVVAHRHREHPG